MPVECDSNENTNFILIITNFLKLNEFMIISAKNGIYHQGSGLFKKN